MLYASLESLGAFVFLLMTVGVCCRIASRILWVMVAEMSESGMHGVYLVCLFARSRPYVAVQKVGRVVVKEYAHVLS